MLKGCTRKAVHACLLAGRAEEEAAQGEVALQYLQLGWNEGSLFLELLLREKLAE